MSYEKRNIKLTYLDYEMLPEYIINDFKKTLLLDDVNKLCGNFDRINLLKDTKYAKEIDVVAGVFGKETPEFETKMKIIKSKKLF